MEQIAKDFKDKGVAFYMVYTREPHAGEKLLGFNFSGKKQTRTHRERVDHALGMLKQYRQERPILIDEFGENSLQEKIGGGVPNSLLVIDPEGRAALWQQWSDPKALREKLQDMTGPAADASAPELPAGRSNAPAPTPSRGRAQ